MAVGAKHSRYFSRRLLHTDEEVPMGDRCLLVISFVVPDWSVAFRHFAWKIGALDCTM